MVPPPAILTGNPQASLVLSSIPKVGELGTTSGPLKSAAFFIGAYCKDCSGLPRGMGVHMEFAGTELWDFPEDFMLCEVEIRDFGHCPKEGRRVTRWNPEALSPLLTLPSDDPLPSSESKAGFQSTPSGFAYKREKSRMFSCVACRYGPGHNANERHQAKLDGALLGKFASDR